MVELIALGRGQAVTLDIRTFTFRRRGCSFKVESWDSVLREYLAVFTVSPRALTLPNPSHPSHPHTHSGLSAILALQFPRFLREVKASGASPDVIGKLYLFHQTNIVRTGLRFLFVVAAVIAGADGLSNGKPINSTP
jgi:hypothetical protein